MKKVLLMPLLCISIYANAQHIQTDDQLTYVQEASTALKPLIEKDSKSYKNNTLYDKVMPIANLSEFNNSAQPLAHPLLFKRAWQELYNARVSKTDKHLSLEKLKQIAAHYQRNGIVQLGLINTDFTQLNKKTVKALLEKKISITQLAKRNERKIKGDLGSESPYENKHVFMVSPITHTVTTLANTNVQFEIGLLALNQSSQKIKTLEVVYEGKTTTLIQNSKLIKPTFSQRFRTSGGKDMLFKALFSNGKSLSHTAKFNVVVKTAQRIANTTVKIRATEPFRGYDEPEDCDGDCFGEGEYQVFLGKNNSSLKKPVIILDGFDPGDLRKIKEGKGSIVQLIDNDFKEENMFKFKDAGFDVVILNFPKRTIKTETDKFWHPFLNKYIYKTVEEERDGGADYVERNANVLKALIVKLNKELEENGSDEHLKIIGPSMGGLISRVALTQMEKADQEHNVDIWVSFDAPQLGANIPLGLQYFFNFMDLEQNKSLKTPAAQQMLINQAIDQNYIKRNRFKNTLAVLGFPTKTRNVALLNGSINGTRVGTPKGKMLNLDFEGLKGLFGSVVKYEIDTYASHDGGRHRIFQRYKRILFWRDTHTAFLISDGRRGSLDNSPGGYYDMRNEFESALGIELPLTNLNAGTAINSLYNVTDQPTKIGLQILIPLILYATNSSIYLDIYQGKPSFIPTKSGLAFRGSSKLLHENLSNRNLVCTGETPFDSYYAPNENQEHITLNSKNMAWILEELKGNAPGSVGFVQTTVSNISGISKLCEGQTTVYSIDNCATSSVSWTTSSNLQILSSTNQQATVKSINSDAPIGWIRVTLPNGNYKSKKILGKPSISYEKNNFKNPRLTVYGVGMPLNQQGITNTQWIKTGGTGQIITNSYNTYATGPGSNWYVSGLLKVTNSCGTTTKNFYVSPSNFISHKFQWRKIGENKYKLVSSSSEKQLREDNVPLKAELYNISGIKIKISIENNIVNLNNQPKGSLMILKAIKDGEVISKIIVID